MNTQLNYPEGAARSIGENTLTFTDVKLAIIKPFEKTAHVETINPTSFDLASFDSYVPIFLAYRLKDNSEAAYLDMSRRIKDSLQKVLVPFFSFGGRWIASPPGSRGRKLLCNDEGVPFIEAYLDRNIDTVVHASTAFQPVPELQGYSYVGMDMTQYRQEMQPDGLPCLFVQVTRFKCGGIVLALTFSHMLTDATSFFNFMTAWSDIARVGETAIQVDHNRAVAERPESVLKALSSSIASLRAAANAVNSHEPVTKKAPWTLKTFEVRASTIISIKQEVQDNKDGFVSTGDCVNAHIWKALARLPSSLLGGKEEVVISMGVEGRIKFFDPPLPNLCGNVLQAMVVPSITPSELQEMSVASIATKFREKLRATTREEWLGLKLTLDYFQTISSGSKAKVVATSWFRFPMYDIDFGFGKPYFAPGKNGIHMYSEGFVYIGPPIPSTSGSIATVCISSSPEVVEALQRDEEFLSLFLSE